MSSSTPPPRTLFDKLWDAHHVAKLADGRSLIHIDRHLVHELSSPQAFAGLRMAGRRVRNPERTFAMADHIVSTEPGRTARSLSIPHYQHGRARDPPLRPR